MHKAVKEASLYKPLVEGALAEGWKLFRIADGSFGLKPCDITGVAADGLAVCLEVKSLTRELLPVETFPYQHFSAHQINWLRAYCEVGAYALMGIYEIPTSRMKLFRLTDVSLIHAHVGVEEIPMVELVKNKLNQYCGWNRFLDLKEPAPAIYVFPDYRIELV